MLKQDYAMFYNRCSPTYVRANRVECVICQSPPTPGALYYTISKYEYTEHTGKSPLQLCLPLLKH